MSRPDLEPLDTQLADLLDAERRRPDVGVDVRERVLERVHVTLGLGDPGGGGDGAPPAAGASGAGAGAAAAAAPLAGLLKPILLGLALGGAVVAGTVARPAPTAAPRFEAPATTVAAAIPDRIEEPKRAPDPPVATSVPAVPGAAAPAPPAEPSAAAAREASLAAERRLLDEAQRALASGRSGEAFASLERHAGDFSRGRLSEEREGLWIRALIDAGRLDEARARAGRFRRLFPGSMSLPALESTLGTIP